MSLPNLRPFTFFVFFVLFTVIHAQTNAKGRNGGFDHRAHSVPGPDQTVYDIDDNGFEKIHLDGIGSHSHFFDAGPPIVSGKIVSFRWKMTSSNQQFCTSRTCDHDFPVGSTQITLTVTDNTGDTVSDTLLVTVLAKNAISEIPRIDSISPNQGQAAGGNTVTIDGAFLYRDSVVLFGGVPATDIEHINLRRITCKAPGGSGTTTVTVRSSIGTSNGLQYTYQEGSNIPIRFILDTWKNKDNSEYKIEEISCITLGRDHRYYMGSLLGTVTSAYVDRSLTVQSSCTGAYMGTDRSITGIGFNPLDPYNRVFVSTNTHFHKSKGVRWDSARIEAVDIDANGCPNRGPVIISGLPTSNHDHGTNSITFLKDGRMLATIGSFTNAGVSKPGDGIGGIPENPLSGSIVVANYLAPGFNGKIVYDQYDNPGTALITGGNVEPYAVGVRNSFGIMQHSNGQVYATDNGPNTGFGARSVSCTEEGPDPESGDKLLRIVQGTYYGHPNRNRGRFDPRQCVFKDIWEPDTSNYMRAIGRMTSSTNGLIEYRGNSFTGSLKGNLLMSKVAFGADGQVWRAELNKPGTALLAEPYEFYDQSGLSLTMGLYGELIMPQLKKYRVLALQPDQPGATNVDIIQVHPNTGPRSGGQEVFITGHFLNDPDLVIQFGDKPCTNIVDIKYQHVRCLTPAGTGKVSVVATTKGVSSVSYGHEYEYL